MRMKRTDRLEPAKPVGRLLGTGVAAEGPAGGKGMQGIFHTDRTVRLGMTIFGAGRLSRIRVTV